MNIKKITFLSVSLAGALAFAEEAAALPPVATVTDVAYAQGTTRRVTVTYKLAGTKAVVTLDVLTNGVSVGGAALANVTGDVNHWIEPGDDVKTILWRPRKTLPNLKFEQGEVSVVVKAWDAGAMPPFLAVDLRSGTPADGRIAYYASEDAVPGGVSNDLYKTEAILLKLVPAAGESFAMGSPASEMGRNAARERHHMVSFTNDFYMGIYPVTAAQHDFATGKGLDGYDPRSSYQKGDAVSLRGSKVRWPTDGHKVDSGSYIAAWRNKYGVDFDVPTSAQWEYVCRAGTRTIFYWGTDTNKTALAAHGYTAEGTDNIVGLHIPNGWGFHDLVSAPWEMCLDWTGPTEGLSDIEPTGPLGPSSDDQNRFVGRGKASAIDGARSAKVNPQSRSYAAYAYRLMCPVTLKW